MRLQTRPRQRYCAVMPVMIPLSLRQNIRTTIEVLFEEELAAVIGRCRYDRGGGLNKGYRHGHRDRQLVGNFGTETVSLPLARIDNEEGKITEWRSRALPRYQRLTSEAPAAIVPRPGSPLFPESRQVRAADRVDVPGDLLGWPVPLWQFTKLRVP